jgi:ABC-type amino acid transport substrate-binding protein
MQYAMQILTTSLCMLLAAIPVWAAPEGPPEGRRQLVDALDAAWVRILDKGIFRDIVSVHDADDLVINISDCLPRPEVTPFPENPTGTLKRILDKRVIKVGVSTGGKLDAGTSATRFTAMGDDVLAAILDEIAAHYETGKIAAEYVSIQPPFPNTSILNSGSVDIIGMVNALGGESEDLRRRTSRRFTCTMTATRQILWLKKDGGPSWKTVNDAANDPDAKFCAGPLSNQLTHAYFDLPGQEVRTEFFSDLDRCLTKLFNGKVDAMMSPFPSERFFPAEIDTDGDGKPDTKTAGLFRPIDTNIVAGTPLWVALD